MDTFRTDFIDNSGIFRSACVSIAFVVACGLWVHVVHVPNVNRLPSNVTDELKKGAFHKTVDASSDVYARCKIMFALFQKIN